MKKNYILYFFILLLTFLLFFLTCNNKNINTNDSYILISKYKLKELKTKKDQLIKLTNYLKVKKDSLLKNDTIIKVKYKTLTKIVYKSSKKELDSLIKLNLNLSKKVSITDSIPLVKISEKLIYADECKELLLNCNNVKVLQDSIIYIDSLTINNLETTVNIQDTIIQKQNHKIKKQKIKNLFMKIGLFSITTIGTIIYITK
jgi:hypothetical protein